MDELLKVVADAADACARSGYGTLDEPDWSGNTKCHDWRNHVPEEALEHWGEMGIESRAFVYIMAAWQASNEEWD